MNEEKNIIEGLVSVITPVYNSEEFIEETICSVLNQTYKFWEMIVVDDGSTDSTAEIVKEFSERNERIKLFRNEVNLGVAKSRNKALELARGQYVAFLDSDDLWVSSKLEQQINTMREKNIAFCYGDCLVIDQNGEATGIKRVAPKTITYQQLLKGNPIPCMTVVIDRTIVGDIRMPDIGHEDYATWLLVLRMTTQVCGTQTILGKYRIRKQSLSFNKIQAVVWQWRIYRNFLGLGLIESGWFYAHYIMRAVLKRI